MADQSVGVSVKLSIDLGMEWLLLMRQEIMHGIHDAHSASATPTQKSQFRLPPMVEKHALLLMYDLWRVDRRLDAQCNRIDAVFDEPRRPKQSIRSGPAECRQIRDSRARAQSLCAEVVGLEMIGRTHEADRVTGVLQGSRQGAGVPGCSTPWITEPDAEQWQLRVVARLNGA